MRIIVKGQKSSKKYLIHFFLERIEQFFDENCKKNKSYSLSKLKDIVNRSETKKLIEDKLKDTLSIFYPDGFSSFKMYEESVVILTYSVVEDSFNIKGNKIFRELLSDYIIREYGDVIKDCFETKKCFKRKE